MRSKNKSVPPIHKIPRVDERAIYMSFENQWHIRQSYKEIIGLHEVDHFSINVVSPQGRMSIISYNPSIFHQIYQDGTYLYNGSISPTYYEVLDFYTWDQCYDKRFYWNVKNSLEVKNGIKIGLVIVVRINGFCLLFSFASKKIKNTLLDLANENRKLFMDMGFHCLNQVKSVYSEYHSCNDIYSVKQENKYTFHKHLKIIK